MRFTNVVFGLFHNLDQLNAAGQKLKIKLAFCAFGGRINLSQAINLYL